MRFTNIFVGRIAEGGLALCIAMVPGFARAAEKPLELKMATIAPRDSSYHRSLAEMGEKWRQITDGKVRLNVYPGGTLGSEADTVNLMQTGSLDASLLTVVGLSDIEPAVAALQNMPMAFRSLAEVDYVG
jgi:TRAP-type C4-dicarboxylate transport system substrate-binding protein